MEKLIIKNDTDLSIQDAIKLVEHVIYMGRISKDGKQYCYLSIYEIGGKEYHVSTGLNKQSDTFTIYEAGESYFDK